MNRETEQQNRTVEYHQFETGQQVNEKQQTSEWSKWISTRKQYHRMNEQNLLYHN